MTFCCDFQHEVHQYTRQRSTIALREFKSQVVNSQSSFISSNRRHQANNSAKRKLKLSNENQFETLRLHVENNYATLI